MTRRNIGVATPLERNRSPHYGVCSKMGEAKEKMKRKPYRMFTLCA